MAYRRKVALSDEPATLRKQVEDELSQIEQAFNLLDFLQLKELHREPAKYRTGQIVFADGTDWDPGSGQGIYAYYNSQWNKLG